MSEHEEEITFEAPEPREEDAAAETETDETADDDTEIEPDGDGPGDDDQDDGELEDYAPGVAEARLMSEREAEQLGKKLDQERKRHGKRVMELLGDDLGGHIPCPTCMDGIDGFIVSPEFAPLDTEQRERMMQILGLDDWGQMPTAEWAIQCPTCSGFGKIKTGSHVAGREVVDCEDCGNAGWINTRKRGQLVSLPDEIVTGPTGPLVAETAEPDERVNQLRALGFTVIPPLQTSAPAQ